MLKKLVYCERLLCLGGMWIAAVLLGMLVILSGSNVFCRLAGYPLTATYELAGFAGALIAALALADTQRKRGHVELDLFTRSYSPAGKRYLGASNMFFSFLLMLMMSIQLGYRAYRLLAAGEVSESLKLPYPVIMFVAAGGLLLLACAFLTDCIYLLCRQDPDTEALTRVSRKGVTNSIRTEP
ncbi:MAG: TRAP transporter small permease [Oligosphaeraceae bacterium]|nr:TRAP transporter small permease [Oligosphaeraceae bacterium]